MNSSLLCYSLSAGSFESRVPAYGAAVLRGVVESQQTVCVCCLQHRSAPEEMLASEAANHSRLFAREHFKVAVLVPDHSSFE